MIDPASIPLAAYLHWPWCLSKCPYCDFNSHAVPGAATRDAARARYVAAMCADLQAQQALGHGRQISSVFLGGGTPSLFAPDEIGAVLDVLRRCFDVAPSAEITLEVNPGALERGSFEGYAAAGINRVSIGAQSFSADSLQRLGRLHGPGDTVEAVRQAKVAGIERINLDLMHGLPGQTLEMAMADVDAALALAVEHISYYQLTLEPNTRFAAFPPRLPGEGSLAGIADAGGERLSAGGYSAYEVSAWGKPGAACQHNLNYWSFGDYLAIGAGAHGKVTRPGRIDRYARPAHPRAYMERASAPIERQIIDADQAVFEFMLNALRLKSGFLEAEFEARTGQALIKINDLLCRCVDDGLIEQIEPTRWAPTALGSRFLNDLQARFLPG